MTELEMCKAFAELEGFSAKIRRFKSSAYECGYHAHVYLKGNPNGASFWDNVYNPITDLALNCKAIFKYKVSFHYHYDGGGFAGMFNNDGVLVGKVPFESEVKIPRAIIECILKSKGLYNEKS